MRARQVPSRAVFLPWSPASGLTSRPRTGPPELVDEGLRDATERHPWQAEAARRAQSKCAMCSAGAWAYGPAGPLAAKSPTVRAHARPIGPRSHRQRC